MSEAQRHDEVKLETDEASAQWPAGRILGEEVERDGGLGRT